MKGKVILKKVALSAISVMLMIGLLGTGPQVAAMNENMGTTIEDKDPGDELFALLQKRDVYSKYIAQYEDAKLPEREIVIEAAEYNHIEGDGFEKLDQYQGQSGTSLLTGEHGSATWTVNIPETGLYHISALYYPTEGKSSSIERSFLIDGEFPFKEAAYLQFDRIWDNELNEIKQDNRGNDLRPKQIEKPEWREMIFKDSEGYYEHPFQFYLTAGSHTLTLTSQREPMVIRQLKLYQHQTPDSYEQMLKRYQSEGLKETKGHLITVQGEAAVAKSSPMLYPVSERTSPAVFPYSPNKIKVNTIGGYNWRVPGQWVEWEFDAPETGLYNIAFKTQQNWVRGIYSTRKLTIDGEVPFAEMENVAFKFRNDYQMEVMGGDEPYLFKLEKGKHTIRMEATLGVFASLVREVEASLLNLNNMYRKIVMITGTAPDAVRDYRLEKQIPSLLPTFAEESKRLKRIAKEVVELSGTTGEQEALLKTMATQLDEMIDEPDTIPRRLTNYKINTGGMGTWLLKAREIPLEIDSIYIASPNKKLPKKGMGFFAGIWHEIRTFFYSFIINYNDIGDTSDGTESRSITVWIGSGRDQANIIKALIDESFTPKSYIRVNFKLVQMQNLLPATLAGQGPDIAMQIGNDVPVNYGMRHASVDLTRFADFEEVSKRFRPSALVPYTFEKGVYALPETQTFNMLFYRKDVLSELGLAIPETWDDVAHLLAVLNKNRMDFGMPLVQPTPAYPGENIPINSMFALLLMQNNGDFYRNNNRESDLDSRIGVESFKQWTEYYTDYKLEREFDFPNRFRTGQMPIGIADYTTYNQLTVFAPEIRGMWGFVPVPGTVQADGSIRRDVPSGGNGTIMLEKAKDKDAAWEFMKWWTSEDIQVEFGRGMEGLMGAAARYPTANIAALDKLPWPVNDYKNLKAQFDHVRGIPEVPGGYFTGRHLQNAFYRVVVNAKSEARESIIDYVQYIHDEIRSKRKEFGLPQ